MTQICLIPAAASTDFEDSGEAARFLGHDEALSLQLGILVLASVLERAGCRPSVFDLDNASAEYLAKGGYQGLGAFPAWVARRVVSEGAGLFGFSSVCGSYPLTIRIAEQVKRESPGCTVLFGGPQASTVDLQTLSAFPFVDAILRGEADLTLPLYLAEWSGEQRFSTVPGLTWRSPAGVQRNPDAPVLDNLDELPLPAYRLTDHLRNAGYASMELGRGCPFSCTFCSTNSFFRRRYRVKSPQRVLADMREIASRYGVRNFQLVHDSFAVDRRKVVALCNALIDSGEGFTWTCSARTDCVDEDLLGLMSRAGCTDVFFGIETGSKRMQRIINKRLDPEAARAAVEAADRVGLPTSVSLIAGFPEENEDDLRETVEVFMHSLRHPKSRPQLNVLAPFAGTPIYLGYKERMILEDLCSSLTRLDWRQNEADLDLIRRYPEIFPNFYLLPTPHLDRSALMELREFLSMSTESLRWLLVALHQGGPGILDVFRGWRERRIALHPEMHGRDLRKYYSLVASQGELAGFLRERMADSGDAAIGALLSYHEALAHAAANPPIQPNAPAVRGPFASRDIPVRAPGIHVLELGCDIQRIVDALKENRRPSRFRKHKFYRTGELDDGMRSVIEIRPLVARALQVCDGNNTVEEFAARVQPLFDCPDGLRPYAAECLLESLRDHGLIVIYRVGSLGEPCGPSKR